MPDSKSVIRISLQILLTAFWAPGLVFIMHSLVARQFGHEPYVDPVMHFSGGIAIAFFFWQAAKCFQSYISDRWIFGLTTLVAIAWEVMEYMLLTSRGWATSWDPVNTSRDLVLGMCGAVFFIMMKKRINKRHRGFKK